MTQRYTLTITSVDGFSFCYSMPVIGKDLAIDLYFRLLLKYRPRDFIVRMLEA